MAIITKAIKLETTQQNLIQAVIAKQNDCNSRFLKVTFLNEGSIIPLDSDSDVTINAERKDGSSKSFFGVVNDDDTATVPLHSWILELDGVVNCDISIIGTDGSKLTTTTFVVKVEKAANSSDDISSDPQYDVLANLVEELSEANKNIQQVANALKGTASGSAVTITDVSPIEHEIKVQLSAIPQMVETVTLLEGVGLDNADYEGDYVVESVEEYDGANDCAVAFLVDGPVVLYIENYLNVISAGDTIRIEPTDNEFVKEIYLVKQEQDTSSEMDFSSVTLKKCGKNLVDFKNAFYWNSSLEISYTDNGIIIPSGFSFYFRLPCNIKAGQPVTFNCKSDGTDGIGNYALYASDGRLNRQARVGETATADFDVAYVYVYKRNPETATTEEMRITNIQLELGTKATEYEPYIEPIPCDEPTADGTVSVTSLYPTTTLVTDTEGVVIEAEYNRDINKAFESLFNMLNS